MKTWSLSGRLGAWSAVFFSLLLLLLAIPVAWIAVRQQTAALDMRLADQGARFFHEWEERAELGMTDEARAADSLKQLDYTGVARTAVGAGRLLHADSAAAAALPECAAGANAFAHLGSERVRTGTYERDGVRVTLATSAAPAEAIARDVLLAFLVALPVLGVAVYFGSRWLGRHTLAPVVGITATAERLNARRLTERLPEPHGPEEIARLSGVLNALLDRLADGLDQARRFTADAAHELRTPLSILQAGLEELLARPDLAPEVRDELDSLIDDHRRLATICERLLLLSRSDAGQLKLELQPMDLVDLAESAIEDTRTLAEPRSVTVETKFPASAPCSGEPAYLMQVLLNLLVNAVKYNREGGRVRLELSAEPARWAIIIGNTGPGIAPAEAAHVFRRFYRTPSARAGGGNGLGLSLSRELARAHDGELTLLRSADDWTEFLLVLPRADDAPPLSADSPIREMERRPREESIAPGEVEPAI